MPVLITCEHLLNDNFFNSNNELSFLHYLNGEEKTETLELCKIRNSSEIIILKISNY